MFTLQVQSSPKEFREGFDSLVTSLKGKRPVQRNEWQAEKNDHGLLKTYEQPDVIFQYTPCHNAAREAYNIGADLPWAENHFKERVSGQPYNPPPSYNDWPYHSKKNKDYHTDSEGVFSHTYPERYWPVHARQFGDEYLESPQGMKGIRYNYGDLEDLVNMLRLRPFTRQAYLPIYFPEEYGRQGTSARSL